MQLLVGFCLFCQCILWFTLKHNAMNWINKQLMLHISCLQIHEKMEEVWDEEAMEVVWDVEATVVVSGGLSLYSRRDLIWFAFILFLVWMNGPLNRINWYPYPMIFKCFHHTWIGSIDISYPMIFNCFRIQSKITLIFNIVKDGGYGRYGGYGGCKCWTLGLHCARRNCLFLLILSMLMPWNAYLMNGINLNLTLMLAPYDMQKDGGYGRCKFLLLMNIPFPDVQVSENDI